MKWWFKHLLCWHAWDTYQRTFTASDGSHREVIIAWKQCDKCAASKLVHILE